MANSSQSLRILALPLNRASSSSSKMHVYFHCALPSEAKVSPSRITKITNWTTGQWDKLGASKPGSVKHTIWRRGEGFMDRIEFEEWGLKALDKELGPKIIPRASTDIEHGTQTIGSSSKSAIGEIVPLIYPKSLIQPEKLQTMLLEMLKHREPLHRSRMKWALGLSPLTAPFALIPVLPNLPFMYMMWRAWSHWRAANASKYLLELLDNGQLRLEESKNMDAIYKSKGSTPSPTPDQPLDEQILLDSTQVEKLLASFNLSSQASIEINRALLQASSRLKDETKEAEGEKKQKQITDLKENDARKEH